MRRQLPLAPAFAITAHAAQGLTLKAAIIDLRIGRDMSPAAAYVALTRVARTSDYLDCCDFPLEPFTKGQPKGPELLLETLRGVHIDWKALKNKHMLSKRCSGCERTAFRHEFGPSQWSRPHLCLECEASKRAACRCAVCGRLLFVVGYTLGQWNRKDGKRYCRACVAAQLASLLLESRTPA